MPGVSDIKNKIQVRISGEIVQPKEVLIKKDSLIVSLPQIVKSDSVEIMFQTRIIQNATLVSMDVGLESRPGLWQSVEPAIRRGNIVMLPDLLGTKSLVQEIVTDTRIFSPNEDGIMDHFEVSFVIYKAVNTQPQLHIFDVAGSRYVSIQATEKSIGEYHVKWDGRDSSGKLVRPGTYIYKITLDVDTEFDLRLGTLAVTY